MEQGRVHAPAGLHVPRGTLRQVAGRRPYHGAMPLPRIDLPASLSISPSWRPPTRVDSLRPPSGLVARAKALWPDIAEFRVLIKAYRANGKPHSRTVAILSVRPSATGPDIPLERACAIAWERAREAAAVEGTTVGVTVQIIGTETPAGRKHPDSRRWSVDVDGAALRKEFDLEDDEDEDEDEDEGEGDEDEGDDDDDEDEDEDDKPAPNLGQRDRGSHVAGPGWHEPGVNPLRHVPPTTPFPPMTNRPNFPSHGPAPLTPSTYGPSSPAPWQQPAPPQQQPQQQVIGYHQRGQDLFLEHLGGVFAETRATMREMNMHLAQAKANEYRMMSEVIGMSSLTKEQYTQMLRASQTGWNALHQGMSMQLSALQNTMAWKEEIHQREKQIAHMETQAKAAKPAAGPSAATQIINTLVPLAIGAANAITHVVTKAPGPPPPLVPPELLQYMVGAQSMAASQPGAAGGAPPGFVAQAPDWGGPAPAASPPGFVGSASTPPPPDFSGSWGGPSFASNPFATAPEARGGTTQGATPTAPQPAPGAPTPSQPSTAAAVSEDQVRTAPVSYLAQCLLESTPQHVVDALASDGLYHVWHALTGLVGAPTDLAIRDKALATAQLLDDRTAERIRGHMPIRPRAAGEPHAGMLFDDLRTLLLQLAHRPPDLRAPFTSASEAPPSAAPEPAAQTVPGPPGYIDVFATDAVAAPAPKPTPPPPREATVAAAPPVPTDLPPGPSFGVPPAPPLGVPPGAAPQDVVNRPPKSTPKAGAAGRSVRSSRKKRH